MNSEHDAMDAIWRKSSHRCHPPDTKCVEVAAIGRRLAVRDSANPDGPKLDFSLDAWRAFIASVKNDQF